jgi:hypothetical protein
MPREPKENKKDKGKRPDAAGGSSWAEDHKERDYYYDDAHGYETFDPKNDEEDDE